MAVTTTKTNKPLNPRGNDQSPKGYNRAELYSGKALDFDGVNDKIDLSSGIDFTGDFTFSVYMNTTSTVQRGLFSEASNNDCIATLGTKQILARINTSNVTISVDFDYHDGNTNHFIITRSGSIGSVYFNGQFSGSNTIGTGTFTLDKLAIQGNVNWFDGQLSNVKAFNTALTADQVADLYNNPEKIVPTGVSNDALKLWLPMQEGAGTTAYDGSGNGNHGTISGATWQHGIGAPVSQTAVIDWNKGTNLVKYSEDLGNGGGWVTTSARLTVSAGQTTAPDGQDTADKLIESVNDGDHLLHSNAASQTAGTYTVSAYLKDNDRGFAFVQIATDNATKRYTVVVDLSNGSVTDTESVGSPTGTNYNVTNAGNGWYRLEVTASHASSNLYHIIGLSDSGTPTYDPQAEPTYDGDGTSSIFAWGAQMEKASTAGPYVRTGATAQTSDVLLPQGLTAGRDITGVNLFENVRKQGALNLDGNSWAEVHDNASLDFGTGSFSLEAWVKVKYVNEGSSLNGIFTLGGNSASDTGINIDSNLNIRFEYDGDPTPSPAQTQGDWVHIVGTYDETNVTLFINGSQADQDARTAVNITNTLAKQIGRDDASNRYYQDQIAQPRIYNRALTAEEVLQNYNSGKSIYK